MKPASQLLTNTLLHDVFADSLAGLDFQILKNQHTLRIAKQTIIKVTDSTFKSTVPLELPGGPRGGKL